MYLPKFKYKGDLTTPGKEFTLKGTQTEYVGQYFKTYNGKCYTEPHPSPTSKELERYLEHVREVSPNRSFDNIPFSPVIEDYDLIKPNEHTFKLKSTYPIRTHYPVVTESDYEKGFTYRYYVRNKNNGRIQEVSSDVFDNMERATTKYYYPNYLILKMRWDLINPIKNRDEIRKTDRVFPGLLSYVKSPGEFIR